MAHSVWHDLLHLSAAVVLVGGGGLILLAAVIGRRRGAPLPHGARVEAPEPPALTVQGGLTLMAVVLSLAAGSIHLAATPAHLQDLGAAGLAFVVVAAFQAGWALAVAIDPGRRTARIGIVGNAVVLGAWASSRTFGLPIGLDAGVPEPVATPDGVAAVVEVALIALLGARLAGVESALASRARRFPGLATITVVPAVGVVFLATTLAVSLALEHRHDVPHRAVPTSETHGHAPAETSAGD